MALRVPSSPFFPGIPPFEKLNSNAHRRTIPDPLIVQQAIMMTAFFLPMGSVKKWADYRNRTLSCQGKKETAFYRVLFD